MRALLLAALALAACQPRTELVIGFATDLHATGEFDSINLMVSRTSDAFPEPGNNLSWSITGVNNMPYNLPASFAEYSDGQDVDLNVTLSATAGVDTIVSQTVTLSLVSGQTLFYRMGLTSECSTVTTCTGDQTCIEGKCVAAQVEVAQLPTYTPDLVTTLTCIPPPPINYIDTATDESMTTSADAASCPPGLCVQGLCLNPPSTGSSSSVATYIKPSNTAANAEFGYATAISADASTFVVGAIFDPNDGSGIDPTGGADDDLNAGGAYVFANTGGTWSQQAYLKASNTTMNFEFGTAVAISADGNTIAIGTPGESSESTGINNDQTDKSNPSSGAVYVFSRTGTTWTQQAYIKASTNNVGVDFGDAIALSADGNTLAVGAEMESSDATGVGGDEANGGASASGAAYVFTRAGATWTQQAYIKASNTAFHDEFGYALALSADGDTLAVGAIYESSDATGVGGVQSDTSASDSGAVYAFTRVGTAWSQQAYIKASNTDASDFFGCAMTLSGDGNTLAVGAYDEASRATGVGGDQSDNSEIAAGAAYVFTRTGVTWAQQAYVKASNTSASADFGTALALSTDGSTLAVAASEDAGQSSGINGDQTPGVNSTGAVYVFTAGNGTWAQTEYVKATNPEVDAQFGHAVSLTTDGKTLLVGAIGDSSDATGVGGDQANATAASSGAVYVYP